MLLYCNFYFCIPFNNNSFNLVSFLRLNNIMPVLKNESTVTLFNLWPFQGKIMDIYSYKNNFANLFELCYNKNLILLIVFYLMGLKRYNFLLQRISQNLIEPDIQLQLFAINMGSFFFYKDLLFLYQYFYIVNQYLFLLFTFIFRFQLLGWYRMLVKLIYHRQILAKIFLSN